MTGDKIQDAFSCKFEMLRVIFAEFGVLAEDDGRADGISRKFW